jgi:tetratricopeptide (TPR) repeat protein
VSLVRKEVLAVQADFRSPERGQYGFLQDLVRRVAYDTMSKKERKARHLAAAKLLEESWGKEEDEIVEVVASHYLDAYRAVPDAPDAPEIKAKARAALMQAGKRAASLAASVEGLRYYEQAIELAEDDIDAAPLLEQAGNMARISGNLVVARAHMEASREAFERLGDLRGGARVSAVYGDVLRLGGRLEEGIEAMEHSLGVLVGEKPDANTAMLAAQLARILYFTGRREDALTRVEQAMSMAETLELPEALSQAMNTKALLLLSMSRPQEATLLLQHALDIALENNLGESAMRAYNNLGAFMNERDKHQEELDYGSRALELARKLGNRPWEETALFGIIGPMIYLGRWDEALAAVEEAGGVQATTAGAYGPELVMVTYIYVWQGDVATARDVLATLAASESEDVQVRSAWHIANALVCRAEGKLADALVSAEIAFASRAELGERAPSTKEGFVEACETALAMDDFDKTEELLDVVRAWRPGEITPYLTFQRQRIEARLIAARGQDPVERFRAAIQGFTELTMPFWVAVTSLELAEWLLSEGRNGEAAPLVEESRKIFQELGAKPWLERLDSCGALDAIAQAT